MWQRSMTPLPLPRSKASKLSNSRPMDKLELGSVTVILVQIAACQLIFPVAYSAKVAVQGCSTLTAA